MQSSSVHRVPPTTSLRQLLAIALTPLGAALIPLPANAQFMPTGAGPFDYNTTGNWTGGTINGVFSQTPSVAQAVTFGGNSTLTTGLTFSLGGTSPSLTLRGDGTERTVTLGGDVSVSGTTSSIVLGSTTAGNGLNFLLGADRTFSVALGNTLTVNNVVSGANALTKSGTGQLTLAGANTYTGTTTVNTGTLFLNASGALASGNNVVVNSTTGNATATLTLGAGFTQTIGTLNFSGSGGAASNNNVTLNTGSTLTLGGTVTYDGTNNPLATTIAGPGTLALGGNRTFNIGNSSANPDFRITAPISGTGSVLTKTGAGRMDLFSANSYDGGTIVNGGTLFLNTASPLQATSPVTVSATGGGTASYTLGGAVNQTVGVLTLGGANSTSTSVNNVIVNPSGTLTLSDTVTYLATNNPLGSTIGPSGTGAGTVALGGNRTFAIADSTNPSTTNELTISIPITGAGGLTKTGAGTLRLSAVNTYEGGTILNAGNILLNATDTLASTRAVTVNNTSGATSTLTLGNNFTQTIGALTFGGSGSTASSVNNVTLNTGATLTLGDTVTYDATGNPAATVISGGTLALGDHRTFNVGDSATATSSDLSISSVITGAGQSLIKTGTGRLGFQGANTYDGGTIINGGTVFLNNSNNLSATGNVTINNTAGGTASFQLNTNTAQTIGALTFGGIGGTVTSVNNLTIGTGATLTLGGNVTYDATNNPATATISGGTLALGGNRTFAVADSSTQLADLNISSNVSGSGATLTKTGTGRLALTGTNTYDGGTVLNGGVIFAGSSGALGTGPVTINNLLGATSTLGVNTGVGGNTTIGALTFGGGGEGATTNSQNDLGINTSTLTLGGTVTYDATNNPTGSTIYSQSGGTPDTAGTLALGVASGAARTFAVADSTSTTTELTISAPVTGVGGLTKTGAGVLTLSGANTYSGGTIVNGGTLALSGSGRLAAVGDLTINSTTPGTTALVTLSASGTQTIGALTFGGAGATTTSTNNLTLNTGATLTLGGTVTYDATGNPAASIISGGTLALGGNRTFNVGDSTTAASSDLLISSVITGAGQSLIKTGTGRLGFQGANTYDGGTIVNGGTVFLNNSNNLSSTGDVTINNTAGATSAFTLASNVAQTIGALTFGGTGSTAAADNNVTLNTGSTLTLGGTVTVLGTGNHTPNWDINGAGTLALGGNRIFDVADSTGTVSELNIFTPITGAGNSVTKTGAGRLSLNATSGTNYDGGTIVNGGELWLNASNTLLSTGAVTVNNTNSSKAHLIVGDNVTQTIGALTFGGVGAGSSATHTLELRNAGSVLTLGGTVTVDTTGNSNISAKILGSGTLALGGNRTFNVGDSSNQTTELEISSVVSGSGFSLTKTGAGGLRLTGANTYSGGTLVSAGTLLIGNSTGSAVGTGALTVQSGAVLRGTGFISGATTIESGGIVGTGGTPGTAGVIAFTNGLTLNDGAIFNFTLGTTSDKFTLTGGTLTGASTLGSLTINLTAGTGFGAGVYTLFDFSTGGVTTNNFTATDFSLGTTISGYSYALATAGNMLQLTATASAIPEPSTYAAIFGVVSLVGAALYRRREKIARTRGPFAG